MSESLLGWGISSSATGSAIETDTVGRDRRTFIDLDSVKECITALMHSLTF